MKLRFKTDWSTISCALGSSYTVDRFARKPSRAWSNPKEQNRVTGFRPFWKSVCI